MTATSDPLLSVVFVECYIKVLPKDVSWLIWGASTAGFEVNIQKNSGAFNLGNFY